MRQETTDGSQVHRQGHRLSSKALRGLRETPRSSPAKVRLGPLTFIFCPVHLYHQFVDLLLLRDVQFLQGEGRMSCLGDSDVTLFAGPRTLVMD